MEVWRDACFFLGGSGSEYRFSLEYLKINFIEAQTPKKVESKSDRRDGHHVTNNL